MRYLNSPRCRARFHSGVIYELLEMCPRCGARLSAHGLRSFERLRRRGARDSLDWEAVTSSQYVRRCAAQTDPNQFDKPAPA